MIIRPPNNNTQLHSVNNRGPEYAIPSSPEEPEYRVIEPEEDIVGGNNVEPQYSEASHRPSDAHHAIPNSNRFIAHSPELEAGLEEEVYYSQVESEKTPLAANSGYRNIEHLPSLRNKAGPETKNNHSAIPNDQHTRSENDNIDTPQQSFKKHQPTPSSRYEENTLSANIVGENEQEDDFGGEYATPSTKLLRNTGHQERQDKDNSTNKGYSVPDTTTPTASPSSLLNQNQSTAFDYNGCEDEGEESNYYSTPAQNEMESKALVPRPPSGMYAKVKK